MAVYSGVCFVLGTNNFFSFVSVLSTALCLRSIPRSRLGLARLLPSRGLGTGPCLWAPLLGTCFFSLGCRLPPRCTPRCLSPLVPLSSACAANLWRLSEAAVSEFWRVFHILHHVVAAAGCENQRSSSCVAGSFFDGSCDSQSLIRDARASAENWNDLCVSASVTRETQRRRWTRY